MSQDEIAIETADQDVSGLAESELEQGHEASSEPYSVDNLPPKMSALLDSMTANGDETSQPVPDEDQDEEPEPPSRGSDGRFLPKESAPQGETEVLPGNQEEGELLESLNSERGRERIRQVFAERKQYESDLNEIRTMVSATGMSAQDFAQTLEYGRLAMSNNPADWRVALQMADAQRDTLCKRLGVDAPGVDTLSDFPDLAQAVTGGEIQRERAIEMAMLRRERHVMQQRQQAEFAAQQEQQKFTVSVEEGKASMAQYLQSRSHEMDHSARMKVVESYFADPSKLQEFASTYQPQQWASAVRMLYDSVQIAATQPKSPSPISSRPSTLGRPAVNSAQEPEKRIEQIMNSMGL
ncbi:Uncharacterized protein MCB1EB_1641 [Mycoavidus cysteinexigens]|uniref:Uncharacterized protein n=1 Tax=Mycoavidus cysteinexigens TaxID=1553431 RepID=A0A2Z6EWM2_9BURK|nr:hypothetical protein [Mycoavidus cysteinexigens]BBE09802.1 Uncharacterized protein MCB1EB_1641 [Mycoavidus cysteinexigens]GAM53854.1 hypothetical protein EBME_2317 [bacterium endosymbiont of Mortierella elongata FMR23-6]GLR01703.1 hypothetical protein GCM10007934_15150 [Mycoavidus cysteinexigens]